MPKQTTTSKFLGESLDVLKENLPPSYVANLRRRIYRAMRRAADGKPQALDAIKVELLARRDQIGKDALQAFADTLIAALKAIVTIP